MGFNFTTENLINDIKRRTFMPISQITYSDDDILNYADEELQVGIVPMIMTVREDYFVAYKEDLISSNQQGYDMPERAIAQKLQQVTVIEPNGGPVPPSQIEVPLPRIQTDQAQPGLINVGTGYFLRDNQVMLQNSSNFDGYTLRQYYFRRPNKLVPVTQAAQIVKVGPNGAIPALAANQVLVNVIPSNFGTATSFTITADIVKNKPGFQTLAMDLTATCTNSNLIITFTGLTEIPEGVAVGDWVCLNGETVIPQVPVEVHPLLAQRVAIKILEGLGDVTNLQASQQKLKEAEKSVLGMLSNRVEGAPQKIINPWSTLRTYPWRRY